MLSKTLFFLFSLWLVSFTQATSLNKHQEPALDVDQAILDQALVCPNEIRGAKGGVVLFVHGTGSNGNETWQGTPVYTQVSLIDSPSSPKAVSPF